MTFDLVGFLGGMMGAMLDPIALGLAFVSGIALRGPWLVAAGAIGAPFVTTALLVEMGETDPYLPHRIVGCLLVAFAIYGVRLARRPRSDDSRG